jgi:GNAT superfamily N-acetyltransferase
MDTIEIVNYESNYKEVFRDLKVEWISAYFKMEASDYKALDNADSYILQNGGHILVALLNKEPVGVCALIKMNDPIYDFELSKMAVAPKAQGKKIGWLIGEAIKEKARSIGAKTLYLESNTILTPAISLYRKLGFIEVFGRNTSYERCNIQMALVL